MQESISQQITLINKVEANLKTLQARLEEMQHKHNLLRSRQSVAHANKGLGRSGSDQDLADTFERWESVVLEHELDCDEGLSTDPLQQEFEQQESEAELRAQLASLKKQ